MFKPFTLRRPDGRGLICADRPLVMGIINATPDSFYGGSRTPDPDAAGRRAADLVARGADIIDIGAYSSRPGADDVPEEEEWRRLSLTIAAVRNFVGAEIPLSVDTWRSGVARRAVEMGADIVNDISGGDMDSLMAETVAALGAPYVAMHMRGTPATMQSLTDYDAATGGVVGEVLRSLSEKASRLRDLGVSDVIVDPGFGFGKTVRQNYELLASMGFLADMLECPVLAGVSRKSMITKPLGITAAEALAPTTAVHMLALLEGASILRVHDAAEARQAIALTELYLENKPKSNPVDSLWI